MTDKFIKEALEYWQSKLEELQESQKTEAVDEAIEKEAESEEYLRAYDESAITNPLVIRLHLIGADNFIVSSKRKAVCVSMAPRGEDEDGRTMMMMQAWRWPQAGAPKGVQQQMSKMSNVGDTVLQLVSRVY